MSVHEPRAWSYNCKKAVIHVVCTSVGYRYARDYRVRCVSCGAPLVPRIGSTRAPGT